MKTITKSLIILLLLFAIPILDGCSFRTDPPQRDEWSEYITRLTDELKSSSNIEYVFKYSDYYRENMRIVGSPTRLIASRYPQDASLICATEECNIAVNTLLSSMQFIEAIDCSSVQLSPGNPGDFPAKLVLYPDNTYRSLPFDIGDGKIRYKCKENTKENFVYLIFSVNSSATDTLYAYVN